MVEIVASDDVLRVPGGIVMAGVPGSGKSTLAERLRVLAVRRGVDVEVVCPDVIAKREYGSQAAMDDEAAWADSGARALRQLAAGLTAGRLMVYDSPMLTLESRTALYELIREAGARASLFAFANIAAGVARNRQRQEDRVRDDRMSGFAEHWQAQLPRLADEGWDPLVLVSEDERGGLHFAPDPLGLSIAERAL